MESPNDSVHDNDRRWSLDTDQLGGDYLYTRSGGDLDRSWRAASFAWRNLQRLIRQLWPGQAVTAAGDQRHEHQDGRNGFEVTHDSLLTTRYDRATVKKHLQT